MKYPIAEIYDRYSIELLKNERANADNYSNLNELSIAMYDHEFHQDWVERLHDVNGKIWDLESDIRKGKEGELGLEEVGRRAIAIRNLNNVRIEIKNQIASYFGQVKERKYDHASE